MPTLIPYAHTVCDPGVIATVAENPCADPYPGKNVADVRSESPFAVNAAPFPSTYTCTAIDAAVSGSNAQPPT